ncbi:MAG: hypothetical protein A2X13_06000 [Bacteroidetes bacterium GWC2_33_15]|nr:MAG: hypothetical protein A2X10_03760 [Bacteroidetes bacterium GWA2_33_15]OFX51777.1 MAG: hypothetical protein A2X13_06000 [Bacteroidetes bacterium GWC2_33_15]OFX66851.1 MAG: hypothetical protein A2X15_09125 [Bacteroidetes bacterium GWB2_32_14]OFX67109.1 MAG: hypothetical protein A2X14_10630 [Bacteroidetes bacterium GWD2_33_33]HAN17201.1 haloacid dehalogenase [Bacteroidales bacterium]
MKFCVVFDFDGVIIHSRDVQQIAFYESYKMFRGDGNPPFEEFLSQSGNSISAIFKKMNFPVEMIDIYKKISQENLHHILITPGIEKLLIKLKKNDIYCGLCTGKDRIRTIEILNYLNLYDYFDSIVCSDDVANPKPEAESLLKLLNELNIDNSNAVMVGDAMNDILCAHNANVKSIAVSWGDCIDHNILKVNPHYLVKTVDELEKCIESLVFLKNPC